ncbi:MAG: secretin N-terminal domain-containing protein [Phycisphaerae bacterium]
MTDKQSRMRNRWRAVFMPCVVCVVVLTVGPRRAAAQDADDKKHDPPRRAATPAETPPQTPGPAASTAAASLAGADVDVQVVGGRVLIKGSEDHLRALEAIIGQIGETMAQRELEIVTVKERDANEIAQTVEQALVDADPSREANEQPSLRALSSNIILISALPDDMDWVIDIIKQVDAIPSDIGGLEQLVFQLKHRRASDVAAELEPIVRKMQASRGIREDDSKLQIIPNNANNTIMIVAQESDRQTLQTLIDQIDVEAVSKWSESKLTLYPLLHSTASEMAEVINNLIATPETRSTAEDMIRRLNISKAGVDGAVVELSPINLELNIRIIPDAGTNSLIVATPEENVGPMGELIRLMDDVPVAGRVGVKSFPLRHAKADTVRDTLDAIFDKGKPLSEDPDGSGGGAVPEGLYGALAYNISVVAETRTNTVIVSGRDDQLLLVEQLVAEIDRPAAAKKNVRVITVTERSAGDIATAVQEALIDAHPGRDEEEQPSLRALGGNILVVGAVPEEIDAVVALVEQIDAVPSELADIKHRLLLFPIAHRRAGDVATQLEEILTDLESAAGVSEGDSGLQVRAINANNSVMVLAATDDREKIQMLIDRLDVEPDKAWGHVTLTVFPLLHSQASELADVLTGLIAREDNADATEEVIYRLSVSRATPDGDLVELSPIDREKPIEIIADAGTNSLVVATVQSNVGPVGELIRLLDGVPLAEHVDVKLFPFRFADAESVLGILETMFADGKELPRDPDGAGEGAVPEGAARALVYNIGLAADTRTNTLIVSGREEQLELVTMVVGELDRPATALKFPLRIVPLEHADATRIGDMVTSLFEQRFEAAQATGANQSALERERVFLSVDIRSNALIISASDENYAEIIRIARQLDTPPAKVFDQIRIITCERLSATDVKEKIDELWQRKSNLLSQAELPEDTPVIVADQRSNAIIVASSRADYEEIAQLVTALEAQPLIDDTRLFKLEYADANVLVGMLDELFQGMAGASDAFQAPTVIADARSNALIVAATRDAMERVVDIVTRLDVEAGPMTASFVVYPLVHASARQLAERMQTLFDARAEGQDAARTPIIIEAEESSNSLVCSASRDDHQAIVDLLGLLDRPSALAKQFEIFPLRMAKAAPLTDKLEQLFQPDGDGGRSDAIAVEADERTNSIIVWASPTQMDNIGTVIDRLDTATPVVERTVKMIQLKRALAEDFATLIQDTLIGDTGGDEEQAVIVQFNQKLPDGSVMSRKLLRQDIQITADPRTNSLMVMAPADSMEMLEAMIHDFDTIRPITSEVRLFPLVNSDAEGMVDQLTNLFEVDGGADGEVQSQLRFGDTEFDDLDLASVGQRLSFTADPRTNTLLASGAEIDLQMVEDLVRYLDSQEIDERVTDVYRAKFRDAAELADAVQGYIQQEQDVFAGLEDETSTMRRADQQVSIQSLGTADEGSGSLIVGTSRRTHGRTMDMIRELDRPEPQVHISVLIAEVTLTDNFEFGIEIAGQDLTFSRNAVLGPNGIIRGSDFDFVLGTDLGAAGLGIGGFNFTITGEDFNFLLHALQQDSRLEVLSRPMLTVRNGDEGRIEIGDDIPFVESSQINDTGSTNATVGRETVGIILTTTPHISPDGYVTLEIVQEISSFSGENLQLTEGVSSPVISTREVDTNVTVRDGETVVIGGLITDRMSEAENKVPIFGDLPYLGFLFRSTAVSRQKTELLVVLTVNVAHTPDDLLDMSIKERNLFELSDKIRENPLMEGLRVKPRLGGVDTENADDEGGQRGQPDEDEPKRYGPKPKTYGPVITRPTVTTTTAARAVYGPTIVRSDAGTEE